MFVQVYPHTYQYLFLPFFHESQIVFLLLEMNPLALIFSESLVVVNSQGFVLVSFGLVFGLCWLENGFLLLSVLKGGFAEFILLGH